MPSGEHTDAASGELPRMLAKSEAFDAALYKLLEDGWNTSSPRLLVCMAYCKSAVEHAISQRVLLEAGLHGTALSLMRLHFEAVVRAAWLLHGASDVWLAKFSAPVPDGDLAEPQMGPPIPAMLDAISPYAPALVSELRRLNETVKVMHSFVHGGVHLVAHALRGYPPEKLISVMKNRNLLSLMLSNVIVIASQKPQLNGAVRRLMDEFDGCMPPRNHA